MIGRCGRVVSRLIDIALFNLERDTSIGHAGDEGREQRRLRA